jgi:hypothetical protein
MASNSAKRIEEVIALHFERTGLNAELKNAAYLTRALADMDRAAEMVRKDIERNDEPAAAFHVPSETRP